MKRIRILAILCALALILAGLAACGDLQTPENERTPAADAADAAETTDADEADEAAAAITTPPEDETTDEASVAAEEQTPPEEQTPVETAPAKETASKPAAEPKKAATKSSDTSKPASKPTKDPKPKPAADDKITVTLSVDCKLLYDEDPDLANLFSDKGVMVEGKAVEVESGATVLDVLKASGISYTHAGGTYISGISGLSEFDAGSTSGWCYSVNGAFPGLGVTKFTVKDGDKIAFRYAIDTSSFGV
jgi:cytoskeletal protein RodZ